MKRIYLCCPYSHEDRNVILKRFEAANKAAAYLMQQGNFVFSPISHSHPIAEHIGNHLSHNFWLNQDFSLLDWADEIVILALPGWDKSFGIRAELNRFGRIKPNAPVRHITPEEVGIVVEETA